VAPTSSTAELLRERLRSGPTRGLFTGLDSSTAVEICARAGFDWLVIDLEHGLAGSADLHAQLLAAEVAGTPAIVRLPHAGSSLVGRALDVGAAGIMFPRVDCVDQAREAVGRLAYPPVGTRGVAGAVRSRRFGALPLDTGRAVGIVQIESAAGVATVEGIAGVDGVDGLFVGPSDLSAALGCYGDLSDPRYTSAADAVVATARAAGKVPGVMAASGDPTAAAAAGFQMIALGTDVGLLAKAARAAAQPPTEEPG
jgi:4-hydroxy-2-oxoheptanedioate aldolase